MPLGSVVWRLPWSRPQKWNGPFGLESRMVFKDRWDAQSRLMSSNAVSTVTSLQLKLQGSASEIREHSLIGWKYHCSANLKFKEIGFYQKLKYVFIFNVVKQLNSNLLNWRPVWPEKIAKLSIKVAQKWFH